MACEVLDQRAANLLGAALVAHTAAGSGIRAILIKGLSLEFHDLRTGRDSADVDVLVEPGRAAEFVELVKAGGWDERPTSLAARKLTNHSVTLIRDGWPTDLDVHNQYPGLLVGAEQAFEVLWEHRLAAEAAGTLVWITDQSSSIVLWALHSLRGTDSDTRHRLELAQLVNTVLPHLGTVEQARLGQRAIELGADRPLRTVGEFSAMIGNQKGVVAEVAQLAWERKLAQVHEVTPWLQVLREAPLWERPWLAWRAVWPSTHDVRLLDEELIDTPVGRVQSRMGRIARMARRGPKRPPTA